MNERIRELALQAGFAYEPTKDQLWVSGSVEVMISPGLEKFAELIINEYSQPIIGNYRITDIPTFSTTKWRKITDTEKAELKARWFWGDEDWIAMKQKLDKALSFRKTIKGKPTDEQRIELECAALDVDFYKQRCFIYEK